jgi:O-antigen/teichoic acid export membrane protein
MAALSLKKNFSWTIIGNILYSICQWGILVTLAKLGDISMVGEFTLGLAVTAPVSIFFGLSLRTILATDTDNNYNFNDYLYLRIISSLLALFIIFLIIKFSDYNFRSSIVIFIIAISKIIESASDIYYGYFQKYERMDLVSKSLILRGVITLVAILIIIFISNSIILVTLGLTMCWLLIFIFYDFRKFLSLNKLNGHNIKYFKISWMKIRELFFMSLPMGIVALIISLNSNVPRYFIETNFSVETLGVFSAISYFMIVNVTITNAVGQAATFKLADSYNKNIHLFMKLLFKLFLLSSLVGIMGVLVTYYLGKDILKIFYGLENYKNLFIWLMIASAISNGASILWYGITSARYYKIQLPLFISISICTVLFSYILIPKYELLGAAYTINIVMLIQLLLTGVVLLKVIREKKILTKKDE